MTQKKYRAIVTVPNGPDEDWGFFDASVTDGVLLFRCNEETPVGGYDHFIAQGQWLRLGDAHVEE